jgi:hypothetical protein
MFIDCDPRNFRSSSGAECLPGVTDRKKRYPLELGANIFRANAL